MPDVAGACGHQQTFAQVDSGQVSANQSRVAHRNAAHIGICQNRITEIDSRQIRPEQVRGTQIGPDHPAATQAGSAKVQLGQGRAGKVKSAQIAKLEIASPAARTPRQICMVGLQERM